MKFQFQKKHVLWSRQKQGLVCSNQHRAGSRAAPSALQHDPDPSWLLVTAQAKTQKLGMRGVSLTVQGVVRHDFGQIIF